MMRVSFCPPKPKLLERQTSTPPAGFMLPMGSCPCAVAHMIESTLHFTIRPGYILNATSASCPGLIARTSFCL